MKIINWNACTADEQQQILMRKKISSTVDAEKTVQTIIDDVKKTGDVALKRYTQAFDKVSLETFAISEQAWACADTLEKRYQRAISVAYENLYRAHLLDKPQPIAVNINGIQIDKIYKAIDRIGLYIPGGTAPLVSTVLMLGIPAQIAGCNRKIMVTPPDKKGQINPAILYAARLCGIRSIYRAGGAQAIAALAYGTETIPKVDKIFGPGNAYVMEAKRQVAQDPNGAALDMPAGPSEVMIIADANASPEFVAADLLAQAEHDGDANCILLTPDEQLATCVLKEVENQQRELKRQRQLSQSLAAGLIVLVPDLDNCFDIANRYAPEHLILQLSNPRDYLPKIKSAGSVFLGPWSAEAFGDYASGTNHVLPTAGHAKTFSGLNVSHFMTSISIQELSPAGFMALAPIVETLAELETLDGHQQSVVRRRKVLEETLL